jgi:hypothetical protein
MRVAEIALQGGRDAGQGTSQPQGQQAPKHDYQAPAAGAGGDDFGDSIPF